MKVFDREKSSSWRRLEEMISGTVGSSGVLYYDQMVDGVALF